MDWRWHLLKKQTFIHRSFAKDPTKRNSLRNIFYFFVDVLENEKLITMGNSMYAIFVNRDNPWYNAIERIFHHQFLFLIFLLKLVSKQQDNKTLQCLCLWQHRFFFSYWFLTRFLPLVKLKFIQYALWHTVQFQNKQAIFCYLFFTVTICYN